jgi:hypothetical protein
MFVDRGIIPLNKAIRPTFDAKDIGLNIKPKEYHRTEIVYKNPLKAGEKRLDGDKRMFNDVPVYYKPKVKPVYEKPYDTSLSIIPANNLVSTEPPKQIPDRYKKENGKLIPLTDTDYINLTQGKNVSTLKGTGKFLTDKQPIDTEEYLKQRKASGGYLNTTGPNTQEVIGNNPSQVDGVELPQAYVDHGETISNTSQGKYVFSDMLTNPLTGNSFAKDDKKLALSDKNAATKKYDKEAQNTLLMNQKSREQLTVLNDTVRGLKDLVSSTKMLSKGGKMSYKDGGTPPWDNFDYQSFYNSIGTDKLVKAGFSMDSQWGPQHDKLWKLSGDAYKQSLGYDPTSKSYSIPENGLIDSMLGISSMNPTTGQIISQEVTNKTTTDPNTWQVSTNPETIYRNGPYIDFSGANYPDNIDALVPPNPANDIAAPVNNRNVNVSSLKDGVPPAPESNPFGDNLGTMLQGLGMVGQMPMVFQKPEKQNLYQNTAPINMATYDPSQALNQNMYSFNALKGTIGNSIGDSSRLSNLQQAYSNKMRNDSSVIDRYTDMNKQSQINYEQRLGQRMAENNQNKYNVDQINSQNKAARNNAISQMLANVSGLGVEMNKQKQNEMAAQQMAAAYPDIAQYIELLGVNKKPKKK